MPRTRFRPAPLVWSIVVHALAAAALWPWITARRERPDFVDVTLVERADAPRSAAAPPGLREGPGARPPAPPPRPAASPRARRADRDEPAVTLRPPPAAPAPEAPDLRSRVSPAAEWWNGRSAAAYVEACQRGDVPQDSVLDRPRPPEAIALARTTQALNDLADRLRWSWMLDRFREKYAENFPAMR